MAPVEEEKLLESSTDKWEKQNIAEKKGIEKPGNVLDEVTLFIDKNIRIIRTIPWVLGAVGVLVIVRRTHVFTIFKHNSEIPREYIKSGVYLRGRVVNVCDDNSLKVQHLPLLWKSRVKQVSGECENCLDISLAGVKCQEGGKEWLNKNLINQNIILSTLGHDNAMLLESAVYKKKILSKVCINEEIIKQGLAIVRDIQSFQNTRKNIEFTQRLLEAELLAQKKGKGMWKQPGWRDRWQSLPPIKVFLKDSVRSLWKSMQRRLTFWRKSD